MTESDQNRFVCAAPFRMSRGDFARKMLRFWGLIPGIVLVTIFISGLAVGLFLDIRYLIVSAMAVFIVLPMVMMFLYYYHGLGKYCYFNIVDHNISIKKDCLEITMYFHEEEVNDCGTEECERNSEKLIRESILSINYRDILNYRVFSDSVIYPVGRPVAGFIWLPLSAFDDIDSFRKAVSLLSSKLNSC